MGEQIGPFDVTSLIAAATGSIVKKDADGTYKGVPDPAGPFTILQKTVANDGETVPLNSWILAITPPGSFGMDLPKITAANAGQGFVLQLLAPFNRFTLTPDVLDLIGSDGDLGTGEALQMASRLPRILHLTADLGTLTWLVEETPTKETRQKTFVNVATFQNLPNGPMIIGGSQQGKTLTATGNGLLTLDDVGMDFTQDILVGGQSGAENPVDNGVYHVTFQGDGSNPFILTRRTDAHTDGWQVNGLEVTVIAGTKWTDTKWSKKARAGTAAIDSDPWDWEPVRRGPSEYIVEDSINSQEDDYGPAGLVDGKGFHTCSLLKVSLTAGAQTITGLQSEGGNPRYRQIIKVQNNNFSLAVLTLTHFDNGVNSALLNHMRFPLGIDHLLSPGDSVDMFYDTAFAAWVPV